MILNPVCFHFRILAGIQWDVFFWNVNGWYLSHQVFFLVARLVFQQLGDGCTLEPAHNVVVFWVYLKIWGMGRYIVWAEKWPKYTYIVWYVFFTSTKFHIWYVHCTTITFWWTNPCSIPCVGCFRKWYMVLVLVLFPSDSCIRMYT